MKKYLFVTMITTLLIAGCAPSGDIKMSIGGRTFAFTATHGVIKPHEKDTYRGSDAVFYTFYLSNFDMKLDDVKEGGLGPELTAKGQNKIVFSIIAMDLGQGFGTKLREGIYSSSLAEPKNRTPGLEGGSFRVFVFGDSSEVQFARLGGNKDSWVNIVSVKGDTVEGEVHFIDEDDKVEGKFTAKMAKEFE